jgi:hypothetical protein
VDRYDGPLVVVVRRSNDFGSTFGPQVRIGTPVPMTMGCGPPGFLRSFSAKQPSVAVDVSRGPHRGRVYVAWDQALDYLSVPLLNNTVRFETEPNNVYTAANPFVPGGKLRGTKSGAENDWFRFDMQAGQTFYLTDYFNPATFDDSTGSDLSEQLYALDASHTLRMVANGYNLLYTAPRTGTYYLRLYGTNAPITSTYVLYTSIIPATAPNALARDVRDQIVSYSDDGVTWSAPRRMNDSAPGFDSWFPSLAVDGRGRVYCAWQDFRDEPDIGLGSTEYYSASGDGGVTWGPNVRLGDAVAAWSSAVCMSSNGNNMGDYQQMAADGDRVVVAFTDSRLGDPDIFTDASVYGQRSSCPADQDLPSGQDALLLFSLTNGGNFDEPLSWRIVDDVGWLTGAVPGTSGTQTLTANGGTVSVAATFHPPANCSGAFSTVRFITSDPNIPGYYDTCRTVLHCVAPTPTLVSLVSANASPDRVTLTWFGGTAAGATVYRRGERDDWAPLGAAALDGAGRFEFEDRGVMSGARYAYRLGWREVGVEQFSAESWVSVPAAYALSFAPPRPNPSPGNSRMAYVLSRAGPVRLDLFATSGARVRSLESGVREAGPHELVWDGTDDAGRAVPVGIYFARLTAEGRALRHMVMMLR